MFVKRIVFEDFVNYKKTSMFIGFPKCTFKCEKDCGKRICQNSPLANSPSIWVNDESIIDRYIKNPMTKAIVCGGLEPLDTKEELLTFIGKVRERCDDDIVIYTGYREDEVSDFIKAVSQFKNIIIKFGRFVPDKQSHYDDILGVSLASSNQYAKKIS